MKANFGTGFLTTFTLLARDHFTLAKMSWILVKVFFGSSYLGFVSCSTAFIEYDADAEQEIMNDVRSPLLS